MIEQNRLSLRQLETKGKTHQDLKTTQLWHQRAKSLHWLNIELSAQATNQFEVVAQKGGLLHDAFGRVLEQVDASAFESLWQPRFDSKLYPQYGASSPPKAFTLNPPRDVKIAYQDGERFSINLVLFGDTASHVRSCIEAIYKIGRQGLGSSEAQFKLIACNANERPSPFSKANDNKAHLNKQCSDETIDLSFDFKSPAYFKHQGKPLLNAPKFTYLLARMIYRANWLSVCSGKGLLISDTLRQQLLNQANDVTIKLDASQRRAWRRYSVSRRKWMSFDGIAGQMLYSGVSPELIPLFEILQAINIGGKTSFGMGEFDWSLV